jgi:hypothetical protein
MYEPFREMFISQTEQRTNAGKRNGVMRDATTSPEIFGQSYSHRRIFPLCRHNSVSTSSVDNIDLRWRPSGDDVLGSRLTLM